MTSPLKRHDYYLGPLGRLVAVRDPAPGYAATPDLAVVSHKLLSGRVRAERPAFVPRTYSLTFDAMTDAELAWLEQCSTGLVPGSLYWVDPLVRNQLPSSVNSPTGDISDLTTTSGTVAYRADGSQGFGGVDWVPTGANAELRVGPRVPYVSGLPFTGSVWVTRYSGASTSATLRVDWFNAAGTALAATSGSAVTLTTLSGAYQLTVTSSSPPAGAVEGRLVVVLLAAVTARVDSWQVEYGTLSAFAPGPGLAKVAILGFAPDVYLSGMTNVSMSMVEVR